MTSRYLTSNNLAPTLSAPIQRIWEIGVEGKALAVGVGVVSAVVGDLSFLLMFVLMASSGVDWWLGRAAARRRGEFDPEISGWGLHSKVAGIALVLLLRLVEAVLAQAGVPDPHGVLAVVTAAALIYQDLDSIDHHRQDLGGRPIPVLTAVLRLGHRLAESLLPAETRPAERTTEPDALTRKE